jgi:endoglucanase
MKKTTHRRISSWLLPCTFSLFAAGLSAQEHPVDLIGLNIAGAGFASGVIPGKHGTNYFFPGEGYFDKWKARGIRTIRFSIIWERLQPELNAALDENYSLLMDRMFEQAAENDIRVILDVHNYSRFKGEIIGTSSVPISAYQDLMERIARRWSGYAALYAYDIMNEPYGAANEYWPTVAQAGIDGIRKYDRSRPLFIEGRAWSSSYNWPRLNEPLLALKDPADNLIFSAHAYVDSNSSGKYKEGPGDDFDPMAGVKRVTPFVNWLIKNGKKGHIGEFGVPGDDPRWLQAMDNLLAYLQEHCIPMTYWAAGPSWGTYKLSVEPLKGEDRPQWAVLEKYIGQGSCSEIGPIKSLP